MLKIGITGAGGFMGYHLSHNLPLSGDIQTVPFRTEFFSDPDSMIRFVSSCDAVIHLAAISRHENQQLMYDTNMEMTRSLIRALKTLGNNPPRLIFASTTHESKDTLYHASKRDARKLFKDWAEEHEAEFTTMLIPNCFGPFSRPFYNSFVSTFCFKTAHGEIPEVKNDELIPLIYINNLCAEFMKVLCSCTCDEEYIVEHDAEMRVSRVKALLGQFREKLIEKQKVPDLKSPLESALFDSFVSYFDYKSLMLESGIEISLSPEEIEIEKDTLLAENFYISGTRILHAENCRISVKLLKYGTDISQSYEITSEKPFNLLIPVWHNVEISNISGKDIKLQLTRIS